MFFSTLTTIILIEEKLIDEILKICLEMMKKKNGQFLNESKIASKFLESFKLTFQA